MLTLRSRKQDRPAPMPGLTISGPDGAPLLTFPPEVVAPFRRMITGLQADKPLPARLAVTASIREEGATYCAMAMATTIAHDLGSSVCVVELNWLAPGLYRQLALPPPPDRPRRGRREEPPAEPRLPPGPGLAAVVGGEASIDEALITSADKKLAFLPAGELAPERCPVVARSDALRATVDKIGRRFDHLILDIPAILASSDTIALAALGQQCCLVVRQGVTPGTLVRQALDDVKHLSLLGVVLNQSRLHTPRWLHGLIPQE